MQKVVFLQSTARSGTTWLGSRLASHPDVVSYGEFLYPEISDWGFFGFWQRQVMEGNASVTPDFMKKAIGQYVPWIAEKNPNKVAFMDLKLEQLESIDYVHPGLYSAEAKFVILKRINLLKQVISEIIMYKRIEKNDKEVHRNYIPETLVIHVEPMWVLERMANKKKLHDSYLQKARGNRAEYMIVNYEDLISSEDARAMDKIQAFMGLKPMNLKTDLVKQNPLPLSELVENYDELRKAVAESEFAYTLYMPT